MKHIFIRFLLEAARCGLPVALLALSHVHLVAQDNTSSTSNLPPVVVSGEVRKVSPPKPRPAPAPRPVPAPPLVIDDAAPEPVSLTVPDVEEAIAKLKLQPGGVAVINAGDYKRGRATTLKDALDYAPGVFIQPRFGAEESRISIRGSGIQRTFHGRGIKLMQDGVPLNLADGGFDFQAIEPLAAQYIEVYRGANALEYGSTTLGGAINFVSHTGHTADPLQVRAEYGSFDSIRGQISSGIVSGNRDAYVSFSHSSTNGFRDHSEQSNQRFFGNFGWQVNPGLETRTYITYAKTDSELPGNLTKAQMLANPRQANPANLAGVQKRDFELFRIGNKTSWESGEKTVTLGSFWSYKDLFHPIFQVIDQVTNDFGVDLRYENASDLLGRENHFVLGFAPTYGTTNDDRFLNVAGNYGARASGNDLTALNADLYTQNRHYFLPDVALVTGAQFSYAERSLREQFLVGPNNSDTQDWNAFSPKVGLLWEVDPETQIFTNVSRSFEPPSFGELVNALGGAAGLLQLEEQTATTFEIGTRRQGEKISWDLAYYYSQVEDELLSYFVNPPGATATVNADNTIHQGVEASMDIELFSGLFTGRSGGFHSASAKSPVAKAPLEPWEDRLIFRQNYLWNDFRFDNDATFGDNRLPGIPEHYYRAELLYEHPGGIYAGPNVEWVPDAYSVDSAATLFSDPYALLGFKVGYRSEKGFSMYVEAKNLTDKIYAATTNVVQNAAGAGAHFLPGDGRGIYAGFEWKW